MAGRPRVTGQVSRGENHGILKTVSDEFRKGVRRYVTVRCTRCGRVTDMRVTDLANGQQCRCLGQKKRGSYKRR